MSCPPLDPVETVNAVMVDLVSVSQRLPSSAADPDQLAHMLDQLSAELAEAATALRARRVGPAAP